METPKLLTRIHFLPDGDSFQVKEARGDIWTPDKNPGSMSEHWLTETGTKNLQQFRNMDLDQNRGAYLEKYPTTKETWPKDDASRKFPAATFPPAIKWRIHLCICTC